VDGQQPLYQEGLWKLVGSSRAESLTSGSIAQAYIDEATYLAAAEGGVLAVAKSLVQQPSRVWRKGSMLLSFMDETVMVTDGVHERVRSLAGLCSGALAKAEPLLTMPGQLLALEVQKVPSAADPCRVLCRSRGTYWGIQVKTHTVHRLCSTCNMSCWHQAWQCM